MQFLCKHWTSGVIKQIDSTGDIPNELNKININEQISTGLIINSKNAPNYKYCFLMYNLTLITSADF